jgi:hypothetical protein
MALKGCDGAAVVSGEKTEGSARKMPRSNDGRDPCVWTHQMQARKSDREECGGFITSSSVDVMTGHDKSLDS